MAAIIVTGAASGIGLATARLLAASGSQVIGIDKATPSTPVPDEDPGPRSPGSAIPDDEVSAQGPEGDVSHIQTDLTDAAGIDDVIGHAVSRAGPVSGLVNCAGIYPVTPMLDMDPAEWDQVLSINLRAPFLVTRALARHWVAAGTGGAVVNVASTAAYLARPGTTHYAASKAGLIQLTRVMAIELAPHRIRVNAVAPGLIATERVMAHAAGAGAAEHRAKLARIPAAREGQPDEVARAICWLLSDEADYATGSVLTLDGGFTLGIPSY